ncbi:MAG: type II toxin-antitoxin system prevent-host-death family antitoxin [Crocosphaera sp.]|nr:type II toxin-antitoxin system prevent-host-death family antitoxin [Crocosphaera sp.]
MAQVNIHEAKTHLSQLLSRAVLGEDIVIAKAGKPIVRLVPVEEPPQERLLGQDEGLFTVPEDFNDPLPPENLHLMSADEQFLRYDVDLIWGLD